MDQLGEEGPIAPVIGRIEAAGTQPGWRENPLFSEESSSRAARAASKGTESSWVDGSAVSEWVQSPILPRRLLFEQAEFETGGRGFNRPQPVDEDEMDGEGSIARPKKWEGEPGVKFLLWEQSVDNRLRELRARHASKGLSASAQLGTIQGAIVPLSVGMGAHDKVLKVLKPQLMAAAAGQVTSPAALEVPDLARQLGKGAGGAMGQQGRKLGPRELYLAMQTLQVFEGAAEVDRGTAIGGMDALPKRLAAAKAMEQTGEMEGDETFKELLQLLEKLLAPGAGVGAAAAQMPEGWEEVKGSAEPRFIGPAGEEAWVQDLPVHAYMATLRKYFGGMQEEDRAKVHALRMGVEESLQDWGARVISQVQMVNKALEAGEGGRPITREGELQIFRDGMKARGRFAACLEEVVPGFNLLPASERVVGELMGRMQMVLDRKRGEEREAALRRAEAGVAGEEEGGRRTNKKDEERKRKKKEEEGTRRRKQGRRRRKKKER